MSSRKQNRRQKQDPTVAKLQKEYVGSGAKARDEQNRRIADSYRSNNGEKKTSLMKAIGEATFRHDIVVAFAKSCVMAWPAELLPERGNAVVVDKRAFFKGNPYINLASLVEDCLKKRDS